MEKIALGLLLLLASLPLPAPLEVEVEETATIVAVGDVMMHGGQLRSGYIKETDIYDFKDFFKEVKPIIEESDLALANLETTLAGDDFPYAGYPQFNSPDSLVDALDYAGFDTLITANNHSLDTKAAGLVRTAETIKNKGLDAIGTTTKYKIKDVNGIKVAITAYTQHANGLGSAYGTDQLNIINKETITSDLDIIKKEEPDLILVYMHWGSEYLRYPDAFQKTYAQFLADQGVDIVIGSHPHVIQKYELIDDTHVFYSLGNFISNQRVETLGTKYRPTEDGVIIKFNIKKDLSNNTTSVTDITPIPTWVDRKRKPSGINYLFSVLPTELYLDKDRIFNSHNETLKRLEIPKGDD